MYLAAIKDVVPREILGWPLQPALQAIPPGDCFAIADHLRAELCIDAHVMAVRRHDPPPRGLIQHSDRGVQHASEPDQAVLERYGIVQSMSQRGNS